MIRRHDRRFLSIDRDRHGNVRYYARYKGKRERIRVEPGTPDFEMEFVRALAIVVERAGAIGATLRPVRKGTVRAAVRAYQASRTYRGLSDSTRRKRRPILDKIDQAIGDIRLEAVRPKDVRVWRDAADNISAGNELLKVLREVFRLAVEDGDMLINPAAQVEALAPANPDGYRTWTIDDARRFIKRHPPGTMAYKVLIFALCTACRRSDLVRLGPQHVRDGWLIYDQQKGAQNGRRIVEIPIIEPLFEVLNSPPGADLAFIANANGLPFKSAAAFGNRIRKWCDEAGLQGYSLHGLRKASASILAECGATEHEIAAITGHTKTASLQPYTRKFNRRQTASLAAPKLAAGLANLTSSPDQAIVSPDPSVSLTAKKR